MKKLIATFRKNYPKDIYCLLFILMIGLFFASPFWRQGRIPFASTYLVNNFVPWQYYYGLPVKNPAMPDVSSQIFPWRYLSIQAFKNSQWPLWNPYSFGGTPLLANFQAAPFHPGNILFFFLTKIKAWSILVLLPVFLAPLFTYCYLREIKISSLSALIASLAFGFCGFIVCWLAYGTLPWAILWLVLALLAVEKFKKGFCWAGPLLSLSLAFSLFSGHFQTSLYLLTTVLLYLLFRARNIKLLLFFFLGISLALSQILPTIEFYQQSVRCQSFRVAETIPFHYLITLIAPDFYGNPVTRNHWFGHYAEWAGFIGVVPLVLGLYGLAFSKRRFFWKFFAFLTVLSLLVAVRSPIQPLLAKLRIPVFSTSSFSRIIVLYSLGMAVLSAFGLEQLKRDWQSLRRRRIFLFLLGLGVFFFLVWGLILFNLLPHADVARRNFILSSLMFGAASSFFLVGLWLKDWGRRLLMLGLLVLTIFDLLRFAKKWLPFDPQEYFYPQLEVIKVLEEKTKQGERVFGNFGNELNVFKIPGIEGYDPLYIRRYGELVTAAADGKMKEPSLLTVLIDKQGKFTYKLLNLMGVKYLLHAKDDGRHVWTFPFWQYLESFEKLWEDEKYELWRNHQALPRAFMVYNYQISQDDQAIIDSMLDEKTDLAQTVILETEPGLKIEPCSTGGEVVISHYSANQVVMETKSACPGLVFLSDNYYPGWQGLVDGQPVAVTRANYSFRAVAVPGGGHQVTFVYQPIWFRWGLIGSAAGLFLLILISLNYCRKKE